MTQLTEFLKSVEERAKAATPGPWIIQRFDWEGGEINYQIESDDICSRKLVVASVLDKKADASFIEQSITDVPTLLAICKALHGALDYTANAYRVEGCGWADERIPRPRGLDPKGSPQIKARKALSEVEKIIGEGKV